jgi:hypothetical protein
MYTGMVASFCWLAICINLYKTFVRREAGNNSRSMVSETFLVFGAPLIFVVVAAKKEMFGYDGNQPWCYFHSDVRHFSRIVVDDVPVFASIILGSYCILVSASQAVSLYSMKNLRQMVERFTTGTQPPPPRHPPASPPIRSNSIERPSSPTAVEVAAAASRRRTRIPAATAKIDEAGEGN